MWLRPRSLSASNKLSSGCADWRSGHSLVPGSRSITGFKVIFEPGRYLELWLHHILDSGSEASLSGKFYSWSNLEDLQFYWLSNRIGYRVFGIIGFEIHDEGNKELDDSQVFDLSQRLQSSFYWLTGEDNRIQSKQKTNYWRNSQSLDSQSFPQARGVNCL